MQKTFTVKHNYDSCVMMEVHQCELQDVLQHFVDHVNEQDFLLTNNPVKEKATSVFLAFVSYMNGVAV